jgi:hypothetical protein
MLFARRGVEEDADLIYRVLAKEESVRKRRLVKELLSWQ